MIGIDPMGCCEEDKRLVDGYCLRRRIDKPGETVFHIGCLILSKRCRKDGAHEVVSSQLMYGRQHVTICDNNDVKSVVLRQEGNECTFPEL